MITYIGSTSSPVTGIRDATNRPSASEIVTVSAASPDKLQRWDLTALTQNGSTVSLTGNSAVTSVTMVTAASAVCFTSGSSLDVVDLTTGYKVNYTSNVSGTSNNPKSQQSASIESAKISIATSTTANTVTKFNANTFLASQVSFPMAQSVGFNTVIALDNSFLLGTSRGLIIEVSTDMVVTKAYQIPFVLDQLTTTAVNITGLSYSNGIVLASTSENIMFQISWYTGELLNILPGSNGAALGRGSTLCASSSGTTLVAMYNSAAGQANYVAEIDFTQTPAKTRSILFVNSTEDIYALGLQGSIGWATRSSNVIYNFTVVPRFQSSISPYITNNEAVYQKGRRIVLSPDANGVYRVESDTTLPASASTFNISSGKAIIEIAFYGSGVSKRGSVSTYTST